MSIAHDFVSDFGGSTRRLMASSASLPLSTTLLLTIGSLPLPKRPQNGVM
jgi:hypothetical protein